MVVRPEFRGDVGRALFVGGIRVGMQEMNDERFATCVEQSPDGYAHLVLVERLTNAAGRLHSLGDFQPQIARNHRHERPRHAVRLRPGAASEFQHVTKTARRDQPGSRKPALEHGIGRGGGAVDDEIDFADREICLVERRDHAMRLVPGRRRRLGDVDAAVRPAVEEDQIGERSADVDARDDCPAHLFVILIHARNPE